MQDTIKVDPNAPITLTGETASEKYEELFNLLKHGCSHEWRIIENFHEELPRDLSKPRVYAAYCIYCLISKKVEININ